MAYLMRTSSMFLGENDDFDRESYLEGFIFGNPLVLAVSQDSPEGLIPVYIIGRQDTVKLKVGKGITDLTCLIWDPNLNNYEIWIFELKVYSNDIGNVKQLTKYLDAVENDNNVKYRNELIERARNMVGEKFINYNNKIRGALCAQSFSDDVLQEIIENNDSRSENERIVAVKIYRFPVDNENFIFVERLVGEEKSVTGGPRNYYEDIPEMEKSELKEELSKLLEVRKETNETRFNQLIVFLEFFVENPDYKVTQKELRKEWEKRGLPRTDQGLSVSQFLGYEKSGSLRQMLTWEVQPYMAIKDNYRLRDKNKDDQTKYSNIDYSNVIEQVLKDLQT